MIRIPKKLKEIHAELQASSKPPKRDVGSEDKPWWDKYVDYQTHIPDEFFIPLSRVEEMLEEAEEIFRITPV